MEEEDACGSAGDISASEDEVCCMLYVEIRDII
jgi:hypothetical protein